MFVVFVLLAAVSAIFHVSAFALEAVLFARPATYRRFGVRSDDEAQAVRVAMANQGFYNLFLAAGLIAAIPLAAAGKCALAYFCCAFAVAAGIVLLATKREMWRAALMQSAPALLAAVALVLANRG